MIYYVRRFFAFYIDCVIVAIITSVVYYSLILLNITNRDNFFHQTVIHAFVFTLYYVFIEFVYKRSIGKMIFKFKIKGLDNLSKTNILKRVVLRTIFKFIPFDIFSIFLNEKCIMWHDSLSKTQVFDLRNRHLG